MRRTVSKLASAVSFATLLLIGSGATHAQAVPPETSAPVLLPVPEVARANSEPAPSTMSESFADLDRDKDGAISEEEADRSEPLASAFRRLDESHDGRLDLAEFAQMRAARSRN